MAVKDEGAVAVQNKPLRLSAAMAVACGFELWSACTEVRGMYFAKGSTGNDGQQRPRKCRRKTGSDEPIVGQFA
jgi:hypothetical protein